MKAPPMHPGSKIYVAGHRGLAGSALVRILQNQGFNNLLLRPHNQLNLCDQAAVNAFFAEEKPEYVFLAAAKVGGIHANITYPAEFIRDNLLIQTNVIDAAYRNSCKKLLFVGTSCIYPKECPQPIKEDYLLTGPLESANEYYGLSKIAGIKICQAYRRQYAFDAISAMPTNLYGPGGSFHPENSHVLPALIRRCHEAKISGLPEVLVWGTGTPRREFLYADDLAQALVFLMQAYSDDSHINVGCGEDISIQQVAELVAKIVGFTGSLRFDPTKPDGMPRRFLNVDTINQLGWRAATSLSEGIALLYTDFLKRFT